MSLSLSPSASASASTSPSASASPSQGQEIYGIETDIIAIKQVDNLTVIQTPHTNISIRKSIDEITIKDIEDILAGTTSLDVNITAIKQNDDIRIISPRPDNLTLRD